MVTVLPEILAILELLEEYENSPGETVTGAVNANGASPNVFDTFVKPDSVGVRCNTVKETSTVTAT